MILSHRYKFIFVKTAKTAGTSIEIALSKFCEDPDDIITPIAFDDEVIRAQLGYPPNDEEIRKQLGYPGPKNYLPPKSKYSWTDWLRYACTWREKRYYNHMRADEIRAFVGRTIWNEYYKFCVERNPWDRMISMYYWHHRNNPTPPTLEQFIHEGKAYRILKKQGVQSYTIRGRVVMDRICLYENLAEELETVRQHLGLPEKLELPRAKGSLRVDRRHYREVLGPHERDRVAELFDREIELCNYKF